VTEPTAPSTPFAVVHDIAASWHAHGPIARAVDEVPAEGLLLHAAGPTDEGFRTIDVWADESAWLRHRDRWRELLGDLQSAPVVRDMQLRHLSPSLGTVSTKEMR
jgi:hypothetical protein